MESCSSLLSEKGISTRPVLLISPIPTWQETHSSLPVPPRLEEIEGSGGWLQLRVEHLGSERVPSS